MSQAVAELAQQGYSVHACCQAFGLPRANYHRLLPKPKAKTDDALRQQVQQVALDWSCYGYRRVTHELRRQGTRVSHKRVLQARSSPDARRKPATAA